MSDNNLVNNYDVMNGNNAMNGNYGMKEQQVNELVDGNQSIEAKEEQKIEVQEQATHPEVVASGPLPWLSAQDVAELKSCWNSIQAKFVDEPRTSVEQADALVADVLARIEKMFSAKREIMEQKWNHQADISTEDLRTALRDYRSFFNRLLVL